MKDGGLVELKAVAAVAAAKSFRLGAAQMDMSASAVSHAVAMLEGRLGVRLFNRTTRSVSLTEAGEQFLARVSPALAEISGAMEGARQSTGRPAGSLRINTAEYSARTFLMPVIIDYNRLYPDVDIDLVTEGRMVDIVAEGFDLGVRILESIPQDMVAVPISREERFLVVATPDYFAAHGKPESPADLARHTCIRLRLPSGVMMRWEFERHGELTRLDPEGSLTLQSSDLVHEAAHAGLGIACLTERMVGADLASGALVPVLEEWTPPFPGLCLYYSRHRHMSAALRAFIDLMRARGVA
jgi:DNA-binding transcriptional LysR family regulator